MFSLRFYYTLKPLIPRRLQIALRRQVVQRKRAKYSHIWPIDEKASQPLKGWKGWPNGKKFALVLMHDVDTEKGYEKCLQLMQLDEKMGFRSSFNFVPERYHVFSEVRRILVERGFEIGVHGLKHDGKLFLSRKKFMKQVVRINHYLKDWQSVGFVSPSMHRNLDWMHDLNIEYDVSTFDTDPFEPHPEGVGTIFPFWVSRSSNSVAQHQCRTDASCKAGYVELPYTLPQDHTLFILMQEKNIEIWKKKLDWIVEKGGMAMLITHPDYMNFNDSKNRLGEYPATFFAEFLQYIKDKYEGQYYHVLPREMARFWANHYVNLGK